MPVWAEGLVTFALLCVTSLFAITNPLSAAPVYLALTDGYTPERREHTLRTAVLTGAGVLVVFTLLGGTIFQLFGITMDAFRITGGLIVFAIGMDMLQAKRSRVKTTREEEEEAMEKEDVGITPLGIPMIVGPGAITTVMVLMTEARTIAHMAVILAAIGLVLGSIYAGGYAAGWRSASRNRWRRGSPAGLLRPAAGMTAHRIFLLSPASTAGKRAATLLREEADFPLARRLREEGAPLGEVFAFMSALYFRGKLAYANAFGRAPADQSGALVITSSRGLLPAGTTVVPDDLRAFAAVDIDPEEPRYREPLMRRAPRGSPLRTPSGRRGGAPRQHRLRQVPGDPAGGAGRPAPLPGGVRGARRHEPGRPPAALRGGSLRARLRACGRRRAAGEPPAEARSPPVKRR
jgi:multiple antibiotic resistance protein